MPVILRHRGELCNLPSFKYWFSTESMEIPGSEIFSIAEPLPKIPERLQASFESTIEEWWKIAKELGHSPTGKWAHTTACSPNASEFGSTLAWSKIVADCAANTETSLVICNDPWLYRHLAGQEGVTGGVAPRLWWRESWLYLRGTLSRILHVFRLAILAIVVKGQRNRFPKEASVLMVYGHPQSQPGGNDAYFGDLLERNPKLIRLLHVDAPLATVKKFSEDTRTFSLHGWGNPMRAFGLMLTRWRPGQNYRSCANAWLIRRQAILEGSNAQALMIRWQEECQRAWIIENRPSIVAWPWENLYWERNLVRDARLFKVKTIGYQHASIGPHAANQALYSNVGGEAELPDLIFCNGEAGSLQLKRWGVPADRIKIAGALRTPKLRRIEWNPTGRIFVTLPMKNAVAWEIINALGRISAQDLHFIVKTHPMTKLNIQETPNIKRTDAQLSDFQSLRAVIYAASTVGLESLLAGLPTLRFIPRESVAIDVLSSPAVATNVTAETLEEGILQARPTEPIAKEHFFSSVDYGLWRDALG